MKPLLVWAIAPAVVACSALLATYNVSREVEPTTYLTLEANWPALDPATQQDFSVMLDDGELTRWEWAHGSRLIMERRGIMFGHSFGQSMDSNPAEARSRLFSLIQNGSKEHASSDRNSESDNDQ